MNNINTKRTEAMSTTNLQSVLETIRILCAEQSCDTNEISARVLKLASRQIDDGEIATFLSASADDMDRPVTLGDVSASLQQAGVR